MKQSNPPVTQKDFESFLKRHMTTDEVNKMLSKYTTKEEFEKEINNYPTKKELKKALANYTTNGKLRKFEEHLGQKLNDSEKMFFALISLKFEEMNDHFANLLTKNNSRILTLVDPLLKELETRQQDRAIAAEQSIRVQASLDNHEHRLRIIEQS